MNVRELIEELERTDPSGDLEVEYEDPSGSGLHYDVNFVIAERKSWDRYKTVVLS